MKSAKNAPYLVTGATGFIGSHLVEALLKNQIPVIGIDNFDPFYSKKIKEKNLTSIREVSRISGTPFELREMDICELNSSSLNDLPTPSVVIHLAAKAGVRPSLEDPILYNHVNVHGTLKILEFCRKQKIAQIIFGSSSSVYGDNSPVPFQESYVADRPISPYAATKRAGELLCYTYTSLYGIRVAALRFFTVYGPRQRPDLAIHKFAKLIADQKPITLFGDGSTSRDYTYVSDIVDGIQKSIHWLNQSPQGTYEVFNLGGSATTSLKDLVRLLEENLKMKAQIEWGARQPGDVERTFADISKSQKHFDYHPHFPMQQGMKNFTVWFRHEYQY